MDIISVIIPAYNAQSTILSCVQSVMEQTYSNIEIIIVDDGSTDGTRDICTGLVSRDSRIVYVYQENRGVSAARNKGLSVAKGKFVMFVDSDDSISEQLCEVLFERSKHSEFVACLYERQHSDGSKAPMMIDIEATHKYELIDLPQLLFETYYKEKLFNAPVAKLYKKSLITESFNETISLGEDLLFNLNYLKNCQTLEIIPEIHYFYAVGNSGSLSYKYMNDRMKQVFNVFQKTRELLGEIFGNRIHLNCVNVEFLLEVCISIKKLLVYNGISRLERLSILRHYQELYPVEQYIVPEWQQQSMIFRIFLFLYCKRLNGCFLPFLLF